MTLGEDVLGGRSGDFFVRGEGAVPLDLGQYLRKIDASKVTTYDRYLGALRKALGSSVTIVGADGVTESLSVPMTESELAGFKSRNAPIIRSLAERYGRSDSVVDRGSHELGTIPPPDGWLKVARRSFKHGAQGRLAEAN